MSHPHHRRPSAWKRQTAIASRWLHIYLSMISFGIVLFFAVTGLTLNHAEWFASEARTTELKGKMDMKWFGKDVDKLDIVEYIRRVHGVKSGLSDFHVDDSQCEVSFKGPGYSADTFIDRATGEYQLTITRQGLVAVLNDLHKGRDTGTVWAWIIDICSGLMTLISLTGLILIFFLQKRRMAGLIAIAIGSALCLAVYWIWVP
ncbi:MAG: PepSY-associated TM helix domain-containing protein [Acidobacteriota bacterium]|nr:PepSY-associated TM helix domain-containing protein [Acidobacteriota bacterium]